MKLEHLRERIDRLDRQLLKLLNRRTELGSEVGKLKRAEGRSVFSPEREEHLLEKLESANGGPLTNAALRAIYREVFSISRARQKQLVIGYAGPERSGSFLAALRRFGVSERYQAVFSAGAAIRGLSTGRLDVVVFSHESGWCPVLSPRKEFVYGGAVNLCGKLMPPPGKKGESYYLLSVEAMSACRSSKTAVMIFEPSPGRAGRILRQVFTAAEMKAAATCRARVGRKEAVFFELPGHISHSKIQQALQKLEQKTLWVKVLGSYPVSYLYGG
jgi:chorismate mutase-like protein